MNCALSGESAEEPVISRKTGHIFEKRLILKHIEQTRSCPFSGEELAPDDLIDVKNYQSPVRPRPPQATSLSGLLKLFQNEWDSQILESYNLKKQLQAVRQELSHTLYQYDAACRVIARLSKERDDARTALADTQTNISRQFEDALAVDRDILMEVDTEEKAETGITEQVIANIGGTAKRLSKLRKKRLKSPSETLASQEDIASYKVLSSHPLHSAAQDSGITCMDLHPMQQDRVLTGGEDSVVIIFNRGTQQIEQTLKRHRKKISGVAFHPTKEVVISSSYDNTAICWTHNDEGKFDVSHVLNVHEGPVTSLSLHATGDYVATASEDKTWAFNDLETGICRQRFGGSNRIKEGFTSIQFHPDGMILAVGSADSQVRIWELKTQENLASFEGHEGGVRAVAFSENGYYLASADNKGVIKLWDLRKLNNFRDLSIASGEFPGGKALAFDNSGQYLGVAGGLGLVVYDTKDWSIVKTFDDHTKEVTGVKFGTDADFIVSSSRDRTVKFYGASED